MLLDNEQDIRSLLEELPEGLTATYNEIYKRILARPRHSRDLILRAIKWVPGTTEPISSGILPTLIQIDGDEEKTDDGDKVSVDTLLGWCANLLTINAPPGEGDRDKLGSYTQHDSVWRPSHFSVAEYFEFIWPMPDVHCFVAKAYLVYMLSKLPANVAWDEEDAARYMRHRWTKSVQAQDRPGCSAALSRLLKQFLGAPGRGSIMYAEWFDNFRPAFTLHPLFSYHEGLPNTPICAMAYDSLYFLLQD